MTNEQIKSKRKALSDKAAALKELMELGDISYEEYSQEMAKIQIEWRKVKNANVIDVEIVSVEESDLSYSDLSDNDGAVNLPAKIPWRGTGQRNWDAARNPERRCTAIKKDGVRCGNPARHGTNVCGFHGASAPQVQRKAKERLELAADRMAKHLLDLAIDAESENVQLSAVNSALDRAGLKPSNEVVLSQGKAYDEILEDLEFGTMTRAESRRVRGIDDAIEPQPNTTPAPAYRHSESNGVGGQRDSNGYGVQFDKPPYSPLADPLADDGPSPRPSHRQGGNRPRERQSGRHITGEAALHLAAELRGLPPGRSIC
jgi:hypothetical protein